MATLIVGGFRSKCGGCGKPADPHQAIHADVIGYHPGPGCGVRWTHVTSEYIGGGVEEATRRLRPDLEWVDAGLCL